MAKVRVAVWGTVGKTVFIETDLGSRVTTLETQVAALGSATGGAHSSLSGLQVGDDHPQYAMWQAPETIQGLWNFDTIPLIQGETLAEYIEDVVGGDIFDFLQDTSSVVWTYHETANELEANVPAEFVQDTIGTILLDTASINLTYDDLGPTISADVIFANPSGLIGMSAVNGSAGTPPRSDARHAIDPAIAPEWTGTHGWADNAEVQLGTGNDLRLYHDGTDSFIRNDNGRLRIQNSVVQISRDTVDFPSAVVTASACLSIGKDTIGGATLDIATFAGNLCGIRCYSANGGVGALAAVTTAANPILAFIGGAGYDGTNWTGSAGLIGIRTGSNWSTTNYETYVSLEATPNGSTARAESGRFDGNATAGNTRFMVYDVDNGTLERVSVGAADSGGTGFKVLRIPN